MLELLKTNCFMSAHYLTIYQELVHAGLSTKKLKNFTLECTEYLHVDYICHMAQYSLEQVSFLEKILKDKKTSSRAQGQSRKGTCTVKKGVSVQRWCFFTEGLVTIYSMVANTVVEGSMTWDLFLQFLEFNVVCLPVRLWTHILTHFASRCCCVHHSLAISLSLSWTMPGFIMEKEFSSWLLNSICALTACMPVTSPPALEVQIEFLPSYFPDLNLIEEALLKVNKFFQQKLGMAWYLTWCRLWRLLPPLMWLVILYMLDIFRL